MGVWRCPKSFFWGLFSPTQSELRALLKNKEGGSPVPLRGLRANVQFDTQIRQVLRPLASHGQVTRRSAGGTSTLVLVPPPPPKGQGQGCPLSRANLLAVAELGAAAGCFAEVEAALRALRAAGLTAHPHFWRRLLDVLLGAGQLPLCLTGPSRASFFVSLHSQNVITFGM